MRDGWGLAMDGYVTFTGVMEAVADDAQVRSHEGSDALWQGLVLFGACLMWIAGCVGSALFLALVVIPWVTGS